MKNITLYRPVGANELSLIIDSGMKYFPPRLFWQPIFYPVLNFEYAAEIAERVGFVTEFEVPQDYFNQFDVQTVGLKRNKELWIPAEQLEEFNQQIVDGIRITKAYAHR